GWVKAPLPEAREQGGCAENHDSRHSNNRHEQTARNRHRQKEKTPEQRLPETQRYSQRPGNAATSAQVIPTRGRLSWEVAFAQGSHHDPGQVATREARERIDHPFTRYLQVQPCEPRRFRIFEPN